MTTCRLLLEFFFIAFPITAWQVRNFAQVIYNRQLALHTEQRDKTRVAVMIGADADLSSLQSRENGISASLGQATGNALALPIHSEPPTKKVLGQPKLW